jgi:hypothetical protein
MLKYLMALLGIGTCMGIEAMKQPATHLDRKTIEERLQLAFPSSEAAKAPIRMGDARGVVVAADLATIEPDARLKLTPCHLARFEKGKLTTALRSEFAYFKLDPNPVCVADLMKCKICSIELDGGIVLAFTDECCDSGKSESRPAGATRVDK